MKKTLFPLGVVILIISLLLTVTVPIAAGIGCKLEIHKEDPNGEALAGATFVISPDPTEKPFSGELTIVDNGPVDESTAVGVLLITNIVCDPDEVFTITETVAPDGYTPAPPQSTKLGEYDLEPLVLTFINEPIVGGEAQSVNTAGTVVPWIGMALAVTAGILFALKRRSIQS